MRKEAGWCGGSSAGPYARGCIPTITHLQALLRHLSCSYLLSVLGTSPAAWCCLGMLTPFLGMELPIRVRGAGAFLLPKVL